MLPSCFAAIGGSAPPPNTSGLYTFVIPAPDGSPLVDAEVSSADLAAARARWKRNSWGALIFVLGITLLACAAPIVERRRLLATRAALTAASLQLAAILLGALASLLAALRAWTGSISLAAPPSLLVTSLVAAALGWLALDFVERRRTCRPRPSGATEAGAIRVTAVSFAAAAITVMGLAAYERALWALVSNTSLDVLHFSLHPLSAGRLSVAFALVLLHAAVMWTAVAIIRAAATATRASRHPARALPGTIAGAIVAAAAIARWSDSIPVIPLAIAFSAAAAGAFTLGRLGVRLHRLSQSARLRRIVRRPASLPRSRCTRRCSPTRPSPRNASSSTSTRRRRRVSATTSSGGCSGPSSRLTRCPRWLSSSSG